MKSRTKHARSRNERLWLENDSLHWLDKQGSGLLVAVRVLGMSGDTREHEVIYQVEEVVGREVYPASDRGLKPLTAQEVAERAWEKRP